MGNENPYQARVADLLNFYAAFRNKILTRLKDDNVTRTMLVCKAVFDPTTSRWVSPEAA